MPDNVTVSEKPWSDYSKADYTPEQWHAACLIHQHEGAPTSKEQCKLPVRTPNGTLNRNGVHAAAAALAGARGGVDATPAEKSAAARAIVRLYGQLDEKAPPSMMALMHTNTDQVEHFLAHINLPGAPPSPETVNHPSSKGGGNFDESKVKRDQNGKFAKKADAKALDRLWMDEYQMQQNFQLLSDMNRAEMQAILQKAADKFGIPDPAYVQFNPVASKEAFGQIVDLLNQKAVQPGPGPGVSPSGTQRLDFYVVDSSGNRAEINVRAVPYSGPNPHPSTTKYLQEQRRDNQRLSRKDKARSGFRFNPNAILDPSRVHNVSHTEGRTAMDQVEDFLEHVGVKGMKWGVRKSEPSAAQQLRAKVKAGEGTVGEAHQAALKSTGHRAANFFLGDKTYWKRAAEVTGITLAEVAIVSIPGLLPTAALAGVAIGIGAASNTAAAGITLANFHRAIFGNRKITKSMENLGKDARRRQKNADEKTKKLLNKYGSIPKKSFEHSEAFLAHADSTQTVQEVWDSLSPAQLDTMETLIGLALDESNAEGVVIDTDVYNSMTPIQKTVSTFIMAGALANAEETAQHSSMLDNFLKHYGVKGMKWGVRKAEGSGGSKSKGPSKKEVKEAEAAKDIHVSADAERFVKTRMKAQHEMSDREIREAVQRAEWAKKYDAAFNPDANSQLQARVNQMKLQKEYSSLSRELNPTKMDRVNNFITKADSAFQSYQHINELSGGVLNATLAKSMGLTKPESPYERLLRENNILSAEKTHSNLLRDLNEPQSQRNLFPKHSSGTPVGRHQLELPGKHRG